MWSAVGRLLQRLRDAGALAPIQTVVQRAARLAEKGDLQRHQCNPKDCVDASLFSSPAEGAVLAALEALAPLTRARDHHGYERLLMGLGRLSPKLQAFF